MNDDGHYAMIGTVVGLLVFVCSYIYCIASYGFLLGVGLGWLPSLIVAFVAGLLWPLIAIAFVLGLLFVGYIIYGQ